MPAWAIARMGMGGWQQNEFTSYMFPLGEGNGDVVVDDYSLAADLVTL